MTEETDAAVNTHKEGSLGEMKYKDDKRQEIWDKKQARKGFPMVNHFCYRKNPKEKKLNSLSQKESC